MANSTASHWEIARRDTARFGETPEPGKALTRHYDVTPGVKMFIRKRIRSYQLFRSHVGTPGTSDGGTPRTGNVFVQNPHRIRFLLHSYTD
jgi:hypothetical protein